MEFIKEVDYSPEIANNINSLIGESKVIVIRNVSDDIDLNKYYTDLGHQLGFLLKKDVDPINRKIIHDSWTTIRFDERYIEQTYKHSNKHQPLHTDYCNASIDLSLVLLICQEAAPVGGATFFIDGDQLVSIIKEYNPELYQLLCSQEVIFGFSSPIFRNTAKIIDYDSNDELLLNWNYAVVSPDNSENVLKMCTIFHEFLEEHIVNGGLTTKVYLKKNEGVIFRDKKVLHGRDAFLGNRFLLKGAIATSNIEYVKKVMSQIR